MLPGWYGTGTAIEEWQRDGGDAAELREMYAEWPFFRSVVSNMAMLLSKTDLAIAARYNALAGDLPIADELFARVTAEHERTVRLALAISGGSTLLDDNQALVRGMRYRFPYLDPLNHLQVELLRRWRGGEHSELARRGIHLTINGLATGLRNSG
jgi:phosphoenolpyruvate carboxylase